MDTNLLKARTMIIILASMKSEMNLLLQYVITAFIGRKLATSEIHTVITPCMQQKINIEQSWCWNNIKIICNTSKLLLYVVNYYEWDIVVSLISTHGCLNIFHYFGQHGRVLTWDIMHTFHTEPATATAWNSVHGHGHLYPWVGACPWYYGSIYYGNFAGHLST